MSAEVINYQPPPIVKEPATTLASVSFGMQMPNIGNSEIFILQGLDTLKYKPYTQETEYKQAIEQIVANVFWPKSSIKAQNNYIEHPDCEDIDEAVITAIESALNGLENEEFNNILRNILIDSMNYGFCISYLKWESINGIWTPTRIKQKPSWDFNFYVKTDDNIDYIQHFPSGLKIFPQDLDAYIVSIWPAIKHANYYGISEIEAVREKIDLLRFLRKTTVEAVGKAQLKPLLHKYDAASRNDKELSAVKTALMQMDSGAILHLPSKFETGDGTSSKLEWADAIEALPDRASPAAFQSAKELMDYLSNEIKRTIGINDSLGKSNIQSGSYAKANKEMDLFVSKVNYAQQWLERIVNRQLINRIIKYNFLEQLPPYYKFPQWQFEENEETYENDLMDFFVKGIQAGIVKPDESFMRERLNMPPAPAEVQLVEQSEPVEPQSVDENGNYLIEGVQ